MASRGLKILQLYASERAVQTEGEGVSPTGGTVPVARLNEPRAQLSGSRRTGNRSLWSLRTRLWERLTGEWRPLEWLQHVVRTMQGILHQLMAVRYTTMKKLWGPAETREPFG